jgi:hypothetical protein
MNKKSKIFNIFLLSLLLATFGSQGLMAAGGKVPTKRKKGTSTRNFVKLAVSGTSAVAVYQGTKMLISGQKAKTKQQKKKMLSKQETLRAPSKTEKEIQQSANIFDEARNKEKFEPLYGKRIDKLQEQGQQMRTALGITTKQARDKVLDSLQTITTIDNETTENDFIKHLFASVEENCGYYLLLAEIADKNKSNFISLINQYLHITPVKLRPSDSTHLFQDILHFDYCFYRAIANKDVETFLEILAYDYQMTEIRGYSGATTTQITNLLNKHNENEKKRIIVDFFNNGPHAPQGLYEFLQKINELREKPTKDKKLKKN